MGCLLCGLLLVLAVLCTLRVYTKRTMTNVNCGFQLPPHIAARLNMTHSISLPALIDDEYFHREPPPAYSVAVRQSDTTIPVPAHASHSGRRQRSRRHHPRPMIKPPTPPPSSETSNQSSPSRDSITSSSYLSNDDNARLIDT
ncbi:hypothetical protein AAG570_012679 [Ranatra chinensis]|uniref:Secreted protein n=1 Tax=Ranatra chinensis TaxID=642074 RepID=A0ABD0YEJ1_9HEMI